MAPGGPGIHLTYTVATQLADKDGGPDFYDRTQVKILGFRKINPMPPPRKERRALNALRCGAVDSSNPCEERRWRVGEKPCGNSGIYRPSG